MLALQLPADIEKRLDDLARQTGRSKSDYIQDILIEHLEDLQDLQIAEERLRELKSGTARTLSLSDLMKSHGLEN
ncbi:type II toxin-antitoxin system RelB family antitoxin [Shinella sp. G-2]|uniref:type II toxin-antitoxin system RelB family antitoxin n=1 Tax=Shinella sp. G-2 TaxID=3133141 RepID=UPI003CFECC7C